MTEQKNFLPKYKIQPNLESFCLDLNIYVDSVQLGYIYLASYPSTAELSPEGWYLVS